MSDGWEDAPSTDGWEDGNWEDAPKQKTSFKEDVSIGFNQMLNTGDKAISMLGMGLADLAGRKDLGDQLYKGVKERTARRTKEAMPEGKEQSFAGKAISAVTTFPSFPLSPFETAWEMAHQGEKPENIYKGIGIDTLGNVAGAALPAAVGGKLATRAITGAASNAAQDTAVRLGIQSVAEQPGTKEVFQPTMETAGLAAAIGAPVGMMTKGVKSKKAVQAEQARLKAIAQDQGKIDTTPMVDAPPKTTVTPDGWEQMELPLENSSQHVAEVQNPHQRDLFETRTAVEDAEIISETPRVEDAPVTLDGPPLNSGMARRQRGGVLFGGDEKKLKAIDAKLPSMVAPDPNIEVELPRAYGEKDGGLISKNLESGATSAAYNRNSTAVRLTSRLVQNAEKRADLNIKEHVLHKPIKSMKWMSRESIATVSELMKAEMIEGKRFDGPTLAKHLTADQQVAYQHLREMQDAALKAQNEARALKGQKPITAVEAYMASRWKGDFRMPVHDANGKLVWYLAADSKHGLDKQLAALQKEFPGLKPGKSHTVRSAKGGGDLSSVYSDIVDILGRDDPAVQKIKEAIEKEHAMDAEGFAGQTKHHKIKTGVRGYVGDRPGVDRVKDATALIDQQVQYAKNAFRWAEMQKAGQELKKILSDEKLATEQPNNMAYIRDYVQNALGVSEFKAIQHIEDGVRSFGVSPSSISKAVGNMKTFFLLQKLSVSAGYTAANLIQTVNVIPYLADLRAKGYKGNPITSLVQGIADGLSLTSRHYLTDGIKKVDSFNKLAYKYAEDNGISARSAFDESPPTSEGPMAKGANALGKTMVMPEVLVRSTAFMTYVHMLKSSGIYGKDYGRLFQHAEELTNMSMVDYRSGERPMIFSKLGIAGNALNTLQTFPMSFFNQWRYFAKEAKNGNVSPFLSALAIQYAVAGAMGIPGFNDMDRLWETIKSQLPDKAWMKVKDIDIKLWMMEHFGHASVYGALSEETGVGLTSRVTAPSPVDMVGSPAAPVMDIAKQLNSLGSLALDPTNETKQKQALYNSAPTGLQGLVETEVIGPTRERSDGTKLYPKVRDLASREGSPYARTEKDENIRRYGLRSQQEVKAMDEDYKKKSKKAEVQDRLSTLPAKMYDAIRRGDTEDAKEYMRIYTTLTGKQIPKQSIQALIMKEYTTSDERSKMKKNPMEITLMLKRVEDVYSNNP